MAFQLQIIFLNPELAEWKFSGKDPWFKGGRSKESGPRSVIMMCLLMFVLLLILLQMRGRGKLSVSVGELQDNEFMDDTPMNTKTRGYSK